MLFSRRFTVSQRELICHMAYIRCAIYPLFYHVRTDRDLLLCVTTHNLSESILFCSTAICAEGTEHKGPDSRITLKQKHSVSRNAQSC